MGNDYVTRAGKKLAFALEKFNISVENKICADFGSNIGGFIDVLLDSGAKKVFPVETGYGVLDWNLRNDDRVEVLERTNAMHVKLPEKVDFISIDVGWTTQEKILPNALKNLKESGEVVSLLKTHYEITKINPNKKATEITKQEAEEVKNKVLENIKKLSLTVLDVKKSPLKGKKGENIEYLIHIKSSK